MEDKEIVALYWKRDENAIEETSQKYGKFCFSVAWNVLFNKEDADECVNDTWFSAWRYIPPQNPLFLSSFLGKITRGLAIDCLRRRCATKRMSPHIMTLLDETEILNQKISYSLDNQIEEKELLEIINGFLHKLSNRNRDIFVRRYWYMDPIKEIAKRHSISESNVKLILFRIRKKLLTVLKKEEMI